MHDYAWHLELWHWLVPEAHDDTHMYIYNRDLTTACNVATRIPERRKADELVTMYDI